MKKLIAVFITVVLCNACEEEEKEMIVDTTFTISGKVVDAESKGVSGVEIRFGSGSVTTNAQGFWSVSDLTEKVILTPVKADFTFTPATREVSADETDILFSAASTIIPNEQLVLNWFKALQLSNGLLETSEGSNVVSLYDNALSALVFIKYGEIARAEKIFDFFNARISSELQSGKGGFSQFRDRNGIHGNLRWLGDNAWLLIALNNYKATTGNTKYDNLSSQMTSWILSLQDSDGGVWGGYNADGTRIHKVTEGNIDAFNAVVGYTSFHKNLLTYFKNNLWDANDKNLMAWPDNPTYRFALDVHAWSYCVFKNFPVSALTSASRFVTTKTATLSGKQTKGYCFDIDKDNVWYEGTGEMVVGFNQAGLINDANLYLLELEKVIVSSKTFQKASGIAYASNGGTHYGTSVLWEGADTKPAVSSGAWYLFGKSKFNPFLIEYNKNIPSEDIFW